MFYFVMFVVFMLIYILAPIKDYIVGKLRGGITEAEFDKQCEEANLDCDKFIDDYVISDYEYNEIMERDVYVYFENKKTVNCMIKRIRNEAGIEPTYRMVIAALVAQTGKIPRDYVFGISNTMNNEKNRTIIHKFMIWYDKELKSHGFPYDMLFIEDEINNSSKVFNVRYNLSMYVENDINIGTYYWSPIRNQAYGFEIINLSKSRLAKNMFG